MAFLDFYGFFYSLVARFLPMQIILHSSFYRLSVRLSVSQFYRLSIRQSVLPSVCPSVRQSVLPSLCPLISFTVSLSFNQFYRLYIRLSVNQCYRLSIRLSVTVFLSVSHFYCLICPLVSVTVNPLSVLVLYVCLSVIFYLKYLLSL